MSVREDAELVIKAAIESALPDNAVARALEEIPFQKGKTVLIATGKAAWQMASAAWKIMGSRIDGGVVVTKHGHSKGQIGNLEICEAGHPVSDEGTYAGTQKAIEAVSGLSKEDNVLFLLSGGGSALFEKPLVTPEESQDITRQLLACGADIVEMNTIRKRLSAVKGGRFAKLCSPAHVWTVVLSDIIGDRLDMIASGPACPDTSTSEEALAIVEKYNLKLSKKALELLKVETPKTLDNVTTHITGSVRQLCKSATATCKALGYEPVFITDSLTCEARDAGVMLARKAAEVQGIGKSVAFIAGGETVVHLTGHGKGGRNQEIALAAALEIAGFENTCVFSVGSDGTDGPTDAAGGICDGNTKHILEVQGIAISDVLADNDAYNALAKCDGLVFTGPTGTNVNDLSAVLVKR